MTIYSLVILLSQLRTVHCFLKVLTVVSGPTYRFLRRQVRWSGIPDLFKNFPVCCDPHKGSSIVNETEVDFGGNLLAFSMIQQMLAI